MKKFLIFILLFIIFIGLCAACRISKYNRDDFYNVIYTQSGKTIEYNDVTNLYKWDGKVTFTTCDGATVILNDGCVEIIPIDVD